MLYRVWVGGTEVNDHYFDNIHEARLFAREQVSEGYTDVYIEAIKWSEIAKNAVDAIKRNRNKEENQNANAQRLYNYT